MSKVESNKSRETSATSKSFNNMLTLGIQDDNPSAQITTVKLDETNYLERSQSAMMYIGGWGKLGYINGCIVEPSSSNTQTYEKWEFANMTIMSWLLHSMQPHMSTYFLFLRTAKEI